MAKLILKLDMEFPRTPVAHALGELSPTLNVAVTAHGGVFFGVVPGDAVFACDLRTVPGMSEHHVRQWFREWAATQCVGREEGAVRAEFDEVLAWIPSAQIDPSHPLVAATIAATSSVLDQAPPLTVFPGTTDAPWFEAAGIPTIPSVGPGILTFCHGPNEFIRSEALHEAARIYARTALGFCRVMAS